MTNLLRRLQRAAREDPRTEWFDVVSKAGIEHAEDVFGFALPDILRHSYLSISNGGFGPGYHIIGLPGGQESSWGDLLATWAALKDDEEWEEDWLPIIDWGCAQVSIIDCDDNFSMITLHEGEYYPEDYTFDELLERWIGGESPELSRGDFARP
ncbi:SMI1/KNR4 family protein [Tundrisphaera sp. TA3]|uniref:SMI1/KNR4 family protein n=1 Tax=Tundrisphaera sp. TA3 TaxID=3435775 RepID=UPI003EB71577